MCKLAKHFGVDFDIFLLDLHDNNILLYDDLFNIPELRDLMRL